MGSAAKPTLLFGTTQDRVTALRREDAAFDELVSDYQTLSAELRVVRSGARDPKYWADALETLHALDGEIRRYLTKAVEHAKHTRNI